MAAVLGPYRYLQKMTGPIKLGFMSIKISGRKGELAALSTAFDKVSATVNPAATAVFIEGSSGSGKTSLIEAFCESIFDRCFFCRGKFEEQLHLSLSQR